MCVISEYLRFVSLPRLRNIEVLTQVAVPSSKLGNMNDKKCTLNHGSNGERREQDKSMKRIRIERKRLIEEDTK